MRHYVGAMIEVSNDWNLQLTDCGLETQVSSVVICSGNALTANWQHVITWTTIDLISIRTFAKNVSETRMSYGQNTGYFLQSWVY